MSAKKASAEVQLAPVGDYPEKYDDVRTDEETIAAERRNLQVDQDPDYHIDHPTLDTTGPEHDPVLQQELRDGVVEQEIKAAVHLARQQAKEEAATEE